MQQRLEAGQQQHERCHALLLGQLLERPGQLLLQSDLYPCALMAAHGGPRAVGGQLQHGLRFPQLRGPVGQLPFLLAGLHPVALPGGVIGVLHRQCRQRHGLALAVAVVELHQLVDHYRHRPAVGDDVVQGQHQHMFVCCQAQQAHTQKRALLQVERQVGFGLDTLTQVAVIGLRQHFNGQFERDMWLDHLNRLLPF
ncbi:hypothetical protein D3C76_896900 [compost metagenome]